MLWMITKPGFSRARSVVLKIPSPPPNMPTMPPVRRISNLTCSANANTQLVSTMIVSSGCSIFCTMVPVAPSRSRPLPVTFWRTNPAPPQQQRMKLQSTLMPTLTSPEEPMKVPCCAINVPPTSGDDMSTGMTLPSTSLGVNAAYPRCPVLPLLVKFITQQSSPERQRSQHPSQLAFCSTPGVRNIMVPGSPLQVSPTSSAMETTCDSWPVMANLVSGSSGIFTWPHPLASSTISGSLSSTLSYACDDAIFACLLE
mmetsp:Transcript_27097/g.76256  ORF Transcript_27097/g.76256 Transcript_27097/m.76256 type:complete len:256 (+) Transcript_27097:151-918(+)